MSNKVKRQILVCMFAMTVVTGTRAFASPVALTFTGPVSGTPASVVTLVATMTNTSGIGVSLGGDSITLQSPLSGFDDSEFLNNWPVSLDASGPSASYGPAALFTVTIPAGAPIGTYANNIFNLLDDRNTLLTSQVFEIDVVAPVPEPTSMIETCLALVVLVSIARRRMAPKRPVTAGGHHG